MQENLWFALMLTTGAGLSTGLGGLLALVIRKPGPRSLGFTLGFSTGVMLHVSFVELLATSIEETGFLTAHLAFFAGMAGIFLIDLCVPHSYIAQQDHTEEQGRLLRTGLLIAIGITLHNFPEGLATFAGSVLDRKTGIAIAVAVAVHNVPEGLAVAAPIYAATKSRRKALSWALFSGLAEPLGAGLAALVLWPFLTPAVLGVFLALVAGLMVAISLDELLPASKRAGTEHVPILGVILGAAVMATSLWLLK